LAAISGRQQDTALLRLFDPGVDLDRWLAECANAAVLEVQDGEWQFAHDKLRDALLHDMDRETRRELHGHVARVIEQHYGAAERASLLAYHWRQAGDERRESYFAVMAGEQMLRSGSYQDAVILLERALALTDEVASDATNALQRRAHLLRRLAEAHLGFGGYQDAQAYVEESAAIARLIHDRRAAAAAEGLLGDVAYALSEYEQARHHYQEALSLHRAVNDLSGTARILNSLGNVAYDLGDHAVAKQLYQQSLSLSREIGDQWGMAGSLSQTDISHPVSALSDHANGSIESMSWAADQPEGEPGAATIAAQRRQIEERREAQDTLGMIRGLITLSSLYAGEADYHEAGTALRQGLQAARKLDDLPIMLNILLEIARLRITEDKKEQALELLAFVLYHPETTHEDEAERLAFDLQEQLSPDVVNTIWERGKSAGLDAIVDETVRSLRRM
jgi:tetratricopeptide (TPR) repeat protein